MAANKLVHFGPVALSSTLTTNILNPGTTTGGVGMPATSTNLYFVLRHIRIVNKHASIAATFNLYLGATGANAAGTEVVGFTTPVAVGSAYDWYGILTLEVADFLVGGSNTATALTFEAEGEIGHPMIDIAAKRKQLEELREKLVAQLNFTVGQLALLDEIAHDALPAPSLNGADPVPEAERY